jgi:hypothetical protein
MTVKVTVNMHEWDNDIPPKTVFKRLALDTTGVIVIMRLLDQWDQVILENIE